MPTVSQALNGKGRISPKTRARIRATAQRLDFRPNASAVAMQAGRFNAIGILEAQGVGHTGLPGAAARTVMEEAMELDLHLVSSILPDTMLADEESVPRLLRELSVDGLLISYSYDAPPALASLLTRFRVPAIWCNVKRDADCVHPDDLLSGELATQKLIEQGHRNIAYVDPGWLAHYSASDRLEGYRRAMRHHGLKEIVCATTSGNFDEHLQSLFRERQNRITGMVLNGGVDPAAVVLAAWQAGLHVPNDLSIVGIQLETSNLAGIELSLYRIPVEDMARQAVRQLLRKIAAPKVALAPIRLPPLFVPGGTLSPLS